MASRIPLILILSLSLSLSLLFPFTAGKDVMCEELSPELCAFAVSSAGKRCVVESYRTGGEMKITYQCRTSKVAVERMADWVETEDCVAACGADRRMVGISSDALLDPVFTEKLCSPECFGRCPNIIDLYNNLAAGEGVVLSHLCKTRRTNPIRAMAELHSSGDAVISPATIISTTATSSPTAAVTASAASSGISASAPSASISVAPAAIQVATTSYKGAAGPDGSVSSVADAPGDVSEFSIDASSDELDANPIPVPAESPENFFDIGEEDADYI